MRIDAGQKIAGQPAARIRDLLRKGRDQEISVAFVKEVLGVSKSSASNILTALARDGYIERADSRRQRGAESVWITTTKGNALSVATAARPISRNTAEKKLEEFLGRVRVVNSDDYYLYRVKRVLLFGSFLSDAATVNDIDVAVEFVPKEKDSRLREKARLRRNKEVQAAGKRFDSSFEMAIWPQKEVWMFLKSRSRAISVHWTRELEDLGFAYKQIYQDDGDS